MAIDSVWPHLEIGETLQLSARVLDASGDSIPGGGVEWSSSRPAVATIANGLVTAEAEGTTTIVARAGGVEDRLEITVNSPLTHFSVQARIGVLAVGASYRLHTHFAPQSTPDAPSRTIRWTSSDPRVLEVDEAGVVRGVSPGVAEITGRTGTMTSTARLEVVRPYTVSALGPVVGEYEPVGFNNLGQVVGRRVRTDGSGEAFFWAGGQTQGIGDWIPRAISDAGVAVGNRGPEAVRWAEGQLSTLPVPLPVPTGYRAEAHDIDGRGVVVGIWQPDPCLLACVGGYFTYADGIATVLPLEMIDPTPPVLGPQGWIGGGGSLGMRCSERGLLVRGEEVIWLQPPANDAAQIAIGIDAQGTILGDVGCGRGAAGRPVLWEGPSGAPRALTPPGSGSTLARVYGINASGLVVGTGAGERMKEGMLWSERGPVTLDYVVLEAGLQIDAALRINERGQILALARRGGTEPLALVVLTPPE